MRNYLQKKYLSGFIVITFLIVVFAYISIHSSSQTQMIFGTDSDKHFAMASEIQNCLSDLVKFQNIGEKLARFFYLINVVYHRPPLYYLLAVTVNIFFKNLAFTQLYVLPLVFFLFILIYTYKTSEYLAGNSGILSVLILVLFPGILASLSGISLYWAQAAAVTTAFYYFFKCDFFQNRRYSILFGAAFCLGILVKEQFLTFFFGPFLVTVILFITKKKRINVKNIILFLLCSVNLLFFAFTFLQIKNYFQPFVPLLPNLVVQIPFYCKGMLIDISLPFVIMFLLLIPQGLRKKDLPLIIFLSSLAGNILICSKFKIYGDNYYWFYLLPFLPQIAVLIGSYVVKNKNFWLNTIFCLTLVVYPFFLNIPQINYLLYYDEYFAYVQPIVKYIEKNNSEGREKLKIGIMRQSGDCLLAGTLERSLKAKGYKTCVGGSGYPNAALFKEKKEFDIFIFITKSHRELWPWATLIEAQVNALLPELKKNIGIADIQRLANLRNNMRLKEVFPYCISYNSFFVGNQFFYVNIFVKSNGYADNNIFGEIRDKAIKFLYKMKYVYYF